MLSWKMEILEWMLWAFRRLRSLDFDIPLNKWKKPSTRDSSSEERLALASFALGHWKRKLNVQTGRGYLLDLN